jgi:glycosyltransferase involved in cell wall biosynthesis
MGEAVRPKVSVVTVIRNGVDVIERTLRSVLAQDYPNLEFIVIDGGSTDGTVDVIRRYAPSITQWTTGTDRGPYDAMNKGADLSTGEWIVFMNGGDLFAGPDVITRTFSAIDASTCDVIYGDGIISAETYRVVQHAMNPLTLSDGNGFSHQSAFVRTALQKSYGFDLEERIAADYDLFLRLKKDGKRFRHVDVVVSEFFVGGLSSVGPDETIRLRDRVYKKHFRRSDLVLMKRLGALRIKVALRSLVPGRVWNMLKRIRNRSKSLALYHR